MDEENGLSLEDLLAAPATAKKSKKDQLAKLLAMQQDAGIGSTLADVASGLGAIFSGKDPNAALQGNWDKRASRQAALLSTLLPEGKKEVTPLQQAQAEYYKARTAAVPQETAIKEDALAAKREAESAKREASDAKKLLEQERSAQKRQLQDFGAETDLRKEFDNSEASKSMAKVDEAYRTVHQLAKSNSPTSQIAMIYNAVKLFDPNAVKEGEIILFSSGASVPERLKLAYDKAKTGQVITPQQKTDIVNLANDKYNAQLNAYQPLVDRYSQLAIDRGVEPKRVVRGYAPGPKSLADQIAEEKAKRGLK